jgi:DNA-binding beta-propeller fold protein YncE
LNGTCGNSYSVSIHNGLNKFYSPVYDDGDTFKKIQWADVTDGVSASGNFVDVTEDDPLFTAIYGNKLYVGASSGIKAGSILIYDISTDGALMTPPIVKTSSFSYISGINILPNGQYLYVLGTSHSEIDYMDTSSLTVTTKNLASGIQDPKNIAFSSDSTMGFIIDNGSHKVFVMRTSDNAIAGSLTLPDCGPYSLAIKE